MTSIELYDLYIDAYVHKSEESKTEFITKLRHFDFSIFRLFSGELVEKWQFNRYDVEYKEFTSGGSTKGIETKYDFGPFPAMVDIELLQKSAGGQILWLSGTSKDRPHITRNRKFTFQFR